MLHRSNGFVFSHTYLHGFAKGNWLMPQRNGAVILAAGKAALSEIVSGSATWSQLLDGAPHRGQLKKLRQDAYVAHAKYGVSAIADPRVTDKRLSSLTIGAMRRVDQAAGVYARRTLWPELAAYSLQHPFRPGSARREDTLFARTATDHTLRPEAQAFVGMWNAAANATRTPELRGLSEDFKRNLAAAASGNDEAGRAAAGQQASRLYQVFYEHTVELTVTALPDIADQAGFQVAPRVARAVLHSVF